MLGAEGRRLGSPDYIKKEMKKKPTDMYVCFFGDYSYLQQDISDIIY